MGDVKPDFNYIVVGGGIAGVTCVEHLYILHPESTILLLTASDVIKTVTNVQPVTKTLESFDVEERAFDTLQTYCPSVTTVQSAAVSLDSAKQILYTSSSQYRYERLCICTGATPKVIFSDNPHVVWIRDTDSVKEFQKRIDKAKRIVIVGNGGIATEMVYELSGIDVIWAIKDKSINAVFIDPGAAEFLRPNLEKDKQDERGFIKRKKYTAHNSESDVGSVSHMGGALGPDWHSGIEFKEDKKRRVILETEVEVKRLLTPNDVNEDDWPVYVELTNGKLYGCNFVVSATGVVPYTADFLQGNNFQLGSDGGFLINDKMETSVPNVYAAGDVCNAGWKQAHHWFQLRLWTQARQMGSYAAKCMWASLTKAEIYMDFCFEFFSHATKFFGHKVILLGLFNGQKLDGKYEILLRMTKGEEYVKCVMVNGRMQGAVLIGETDLEETFENLILNQMDLTPYGEELLNPNIDIEDYFD